MEAETERKNRLLGKGSILESEEKDNKALLLPGPTPFPDFRHFLKASQVCRVGNSIHVGKQHLLVMAFDCRQAMLEPPWCLIQFLLDISSAILILAAQGSFGHTAPTCCQTGPNNCSFFIARFFRNTTVDHFLP